MNVQKVNEKSRQEIIKRLEKERNNLNTVIPLFENDNYCLDVIHKLQKIRRSLQYVDTMIAEYHCKNCIMKYFKKKDTADVLKNLTGIIQYSG